MSSQMKLYKVIGVCYVVLSNCHESSLIWCPPQSFLVGYFYFLIGYSFIPYYSYVGKLKFIKEKAKQHMFMYFIYNILFALLRVFININFETDIMGPYPSFFNFFIEPFFENRIYPISGSTWFYPEIFLIQVIAQLIYFNTRERIFIDVIYLFNTVVVFIVFLQLLSFETKYTFIPVICVRFSFALLFIFLGHIYHRYLDQLTAKQLWSPFYCFIAFIVLKWIIHAYPDVNYNYVKADFQQHPFWVPIVISCGNIYIHLFLCQALGYVIDEKDYLYIIDKETYHIMFLQGLSLTLVNCLIFKCLWKMDDHVLNISYLYRSDITWPFYFIVGIGMPIQFIRFLRLLKHTITH